MNAVGLSLRQFRFEFLSTIRNRTALVFTLLFPLIFLVLFGSVVNVGHTETFRGHQVNSMQFLVPGIMVYGIIGATYTSLAMRLTGQRDQGVLKRVAGTPLPRSIFLAGQLLNSIALGLLIAGVTLALAVAFYNVHTYAATIPEALLTIIVGSAAFSAMGLAITSVIPNADAATGIIQGTITPILFISDVWFSVEGTARWIADLAGVLPVKHFANSLQNAFNPGITSGFNWTDLAVIAVWGVVAGIFAAKKFRWESKTS